MTIVVYECDTCKRTIERQQNPKGLDFVGHCVITDNCKGKLSLQETKRAHIIPAVPERVDGINDWVQRKILYTHNQTLESMEWNVVHNLQVEPSVQVHIHPSGDDLEDLVEITPESIEIVSDNEIIIHLDQPHIGVAQAISKSSANHQPISTVIPNTSVNQVDTSESIRASIGSKLTLAVDVNESALITARDIRDNLEHIYYDVDLVISSPTTVGTIVRTVTLNSYDTLYTLWSGKTEVVISGKSYYILSVDLDDIVETPSTSLYAWLLTNIIDTSPVYFSSGGTGSNPIHTPIASSFIVLADAPYEVHDLNLNDVVPIDTITPENSAINLQWIDGNLTSFGRSLTQVFPSLVFIN